MHLLSSLAFVVLYLCTLASAKQAKFPLKFDSSFTEINEAQDNYYYDTSINGLNIVFDVLVPQSANTIELYMYATSGSFVQNPLRMFICNANKTTQLYGTPFGDYYVHFKSSTANLGPYISIGFEQWGKVPGNQTVAGLDPFYIQACVGSCPVKCPNSCTDQGVCDVTTGICHCQIFSEGADCSKSVLTPAFSFIFGSLVLTVLVVILLPCIVVTCCIGCIIFCVCQSSQSRDRYYTMISRRPQYVVVPGQAPPPQAQYGAQVAQYGTQVPQYTPPQYTQQQPQYAAQPQYAEQSPYPQPAPAEKTV